MKRTKYKGVITPDIRPLDQRISGKRIKPGQKPDVTEQLLFNPGESTEFDSDPEPAYVKKYLKPKVL